MSSFVSISTSRRVLIWIVLALIIVLNTGRAIATYSEESVFPRGQIEGMPTGQMADCYPGSGWMVTTGPSQPDTASQVRQELSQIGVEAVVKAVSYGETDSCGDFRLFGVDITVEVVGHYPVENSDLPEFAGRIHSKLEEFAKPNLGNVKITFPNGDSIHFQAKGNNHTSPSLQSRNLATSQEIAQVDAALPWQDTGIYFGGGAVIDLEVTSGLWTHAQGSADYNNGVGGSYICANYLPPESCVEPMPEAPQGALIGKIGNHLFAVGSGARITAQQSGNLHLRINDGDNALQDNAGVLTVEVNEPSIQEVAYRPKLYVVVYDPLLSNGQLLSEHLNWADHEVMTQDTIELFYEASNGRVLYSIVDTTIITDGWPALVDGYQYTEEQYLNVVGGTATPHSPQNVDYNKIVNDADLDICGRANRGEIDEVWIFNGPWFGFWESTLVGPGSFWYNSPPVPAPFTCNRIIPIMGPSPERPDMLGHGEGHRMESTMTQAYGGWQQNRTDHNWDRFGLVDAQSPDYSYSGCGSIHYPPNGTSDYDYGNSSVAESNCDDFANYPNLADPLLTVKPIDCSTWGCNHFGYMLYWFGHLPSNEGCGPDGYANDWWLYLLKPELALEPMSVCQSPSPSLSINYSTGQPGSYFTISGVKFPPNWTVKIEINGEIITTPVISADSSGNLVFILDTSNANAGYYQVTVTVDEGVTTTGRGINSLNESVTTSFELHPSYPYRPLSGNGPVMLVPSGLEYAEQLFAPLVLR